MREKALQVHREKKGKIAVESKVPVNSMEDLSIAYTPGVAEPCREISQDQGRVYEYTAKGNLVAVVSDGTAVLGLGDIGPAAALPVMEGKAVLFKSFGNVDAFPICLATKDVEEIVQTVKMLSPTFGGINLEDISAPRCFEVEKRLKQELDIPVFHDDQHGTAVVVLAGLMNALKVVGKKMEEITVVINGPGAAGIAIGKILLSVNVGDIIFCGSKGILEAENTDLNPYQREMAAKTNRRGVKGKLRDALAGADVFIGVSVAGVLTGEMVKGMKENGIIFAMANPVPEIMPEEAYAAGAKLVGTGRSDYPNQINNVLAFPGIFRGALDVRASDINEEMKIAAARAIASIVSEEEIAQGVIIPKPFDARVSKAVAAAVAQAAINSGVARI
jgi:malate dehydrogenase (oxaloacetate-decarboxylating)